MLYIRPSNCASLDAFFFLFVYFPESHCIVCFIDAMSSCVRRDMHFEQTVPFWRAIHPGFASYFREMDEKS